jgi:putative endonuclease
MEPRAWVYIMTNGPSGTLYIGVTGDLVTRVHQHRHGSGSEFCRKYGLTRLVYTEPHARMDEAIAREKAINKWKLRLIGQANPDWSDLWETINC